jgi:hypothetical protein
MAAQEEPTIQEDAEGAEEASTGTEKGEENQGSENVDLEVQDFVVSEPAEMVSSEPGFPLENEADVAADIDASELMAEVEVAVAQEDAEGAEEASTGTEKGEENQGSENVNLEGHYGAVSEPAEKGPGEPVRNVSDDGKGQDDVVGAGEASAGGETGEENQLSETADSKAHDGDVCELSGVASNEPSCDLPSDDGVKQDHLNDDSVATSVNPTEAHLGETVEAGELYDFDEAELPPLVGSESDMALDEPL